MAEDQTPGGERQAKDALVLLPVVASTLAICWEVGRMLPFGGFAFFSISEHILSAMRSLPFAISISAMFFATLFAVRRITRKGPQIPPEAVLIMFCVVVALSIPVSKLMHNTWTPRFSELTICISLAVLLVNNLWLRDANSTLLLIVGSASIMTMGFASQISTGMIERARINPADRSVLTTINNKHGEPVTAIVIMSGEQGLLYYDPKSDKVTFERSEDLKSLEWDRD